VRCVLATHPDSEYATDMTKQFVRYGSSPRGAQSLILSSKIKALLEGRYNVSYSDIKSMIHPALRHRIILNFEGEAEGMKPDMIIDSITQNLQHAESLV